MLILVEATKGDLLGLRGVTFSPEFTRAIHKAIADQVRRPSTEPNTSDGPIR